jgi:hypothetical protein
MPNTKKDDVIESPFLTCEEAAHWLRLTPDGLAQMRFRGRGPAYHQPGGKNSTVLYLLADLQAWVDAGRKE